MKLCLNTSTIQPQPLLDKIQITAEAGFAGIELWINDIYQYIGQGGEVRDVENALADNGLELPCMIAIRGWGEAIGKEYQLLLDEARRRMELAARLGSPFVVATPPREPCEQNQLTDRFGDLLEIGDEIGTRPTLEYISFFKGLSTLDDAWQIIQTIGGTATLIADSFHTWNSHSDRTLLGRIPAEHLSHFHINDAHPTIKCCEQTDPDRMMLGAGPIDLALEFEMLRKIGYNGSVSLELFNVDLWQQNPLAVAQQGYQSLRDLAT